MDNIKYRILEIVDERFKGNKAAFSRAIDGNHSSVNKYIKGDGYPDYKTLYNICTKLSISASWLLLGEEQNTTNNTTINNTTNNIRNHNSGSKSNSMSSDIYAHLDFKILKLEKESLMREIESLKREVRLQSELLEIYRKS